MLKKIQHTNNLMKFKNILLSLAAVAVIPALAQAQQAGGKGKPDPSQLIEKLDADSSGGISAEEAKGPLAKNFDKIDANGDGEITADELGKMGKKRQAKDPAAGFAKMDADGSGGISKEEAGKRLQKRFDDLDTDGSGELSLEELSAAKGKGKKSAE